MSNLVPEPEPGDAFGAMLLARLEGSGGALVIERDDGLVEVDGSDYFRDIASWDDRDRWVLERAHGRVLDVGAGGGRTSLALQQRGQEVVALDVSAGAIEVCQRRGVSNVFLGSVDDLAAKGDGGDFDTFVMMGGNIGLLESRERARQMLGVIAGLAREDAIIVGTGLDPYETDKEEHLRYHEMNRSRGRMAGQVSIRFRFRRLASSWFELLWMSLDELAELAQESGWRVADSFGGAMYAVVLER